MDEGYSGIEGIGSGREESDITETARGCTNTSSLAPVLISPLALWMNWLQPRKSPKVVSNSHIRSAEALIFISLCNYFLNIINLQHHNLLIEH
jgi:hypothetical protein